ncbi:MAG: DUF2304 domain-containing protein [Halodesulfurarchaeum sp.]
MTGYTVVNLLALAVGIVFLGNGYVMVRRGRENLTTLFTSLLVGGGLVFVALFPDAFRVVAAILGLKLKARAILVVANLTLFVLVIYLLNRVGGLYDKISRLNEELSLLQAQFEERDD